MMVDGYGTEEVISYLLPALSSHASTVFASNLREDELISLWPEFRHEDCRVEKIIRYDWEHCHTLKEKSYSYLAFALTSYLTQLHLEGTDGSSSLNVSSSAGCHPDCKPRMLSLKRCDLTNNVFYGLVSVLISHKSTLSGERLSDEEVECLCSTFCHQEDCRLEKVQLYDCYPTEQSCSYLASALTSQSSRLRELELSYIRVVRSGVLTVSSSADCHPDCKPWTFKMKAYPYGTDKITSYLLPALSSHASTVCARNFFRENELISLLSTCCHQDCRVKEIMLDDCHLSEKSCFYLASTLTSQSSHLKRLHLDVFIPKDSAAEKLIALKNDPHYQVNISDDGSNRRLKLSWTALEDPEVTTPSANCQQQLHNRQSCQSCAHIKDPAGNYCVLHPSVSLESGECVYTVSSPAGSYECSESGLRWSCPGPVTLQYRIINKEIFWDHLQMLQYRPVGPPLEIKLLSGELEEVYLPHSLCLGGSDPVVLGDAVKALHGDDSGVSLETCELTRFHGKLRAQHFSVWEMVASLGFPVKSHCKVLIYEHCPWPLVLHTYLLPTHSSAMQAVEGKWSKRKPIDKPSPYQSLWIDSEVQLHTIPDSLEITPSELTLTYMNPPTYSEVYLEDPLQKFKMEIKTGDHTVWKAVLRKGVDYLREQDSADSAHTLESNTGPPQQPSRTPGDGLDFLEEKRPELIQSVTEVMPIADQLLSQRVICQETYDHIQAATTSQDKMRSLFEGLRSAGAQGKLAFYRILHEQQPHLVEDLRSTR